MDALNEVFKKLDRAGTGEDALGVTDLLLLDIARSLRNLQTLSEAGLEFSKGLAAQMVENGTD